MDQVDVTTLGLEVRAEEFQAKAREFDAIEATLGCSIAGIVQQERARVNEAEWRSIARDHGRNDIQRLLSSAGSPIK